MEFYAQVSIYLCVVLVWTHDYCVDDFQRFYSLVALPAFGAYAKTQRSCITRMGNTYLHKDFLCGLYFYYSSIGYTLGMVASFTRLFYDALHCRVYSGY